MGTSLRNQLNIASNFTTRVGARKLLKAFSYALGGLLVFAAGKSSAQVSVTASGGAASGTYTTVKEAVDSINSGFHQGAIALALSSGSETNAGSGPITINGTGIGLASHTSISITATSGYTINAGAGGVGTPATAVTDGIFALNGADNVTIDGLTFTDGNAINPATMEYGLGMFKASSSDGCQGNTVKNCIFNMKVGNSTAGILPNPDGSVGILITNAQINTTTSALAGVIASGSNSNNTITGCSINFANTGIGIMGFASSSATVGDANNIIGGSSLALGNKIFNFGGGAGAIAPCAGIRLLNQWSYTVQNDSINNNNGIVGSASHLGIVRGVYVQSHPDAVGTINNNVVGVKNGATGNITSGIEVAVSPNVTTNVGGIGGSSLSISNNTMTGSAILQGTSAAFNMIWINGLVPATLNANGNNFVGNTSAATTGATNLLYNQTSVAQNATAVNMNSNTFGNATTTAVTFNGTAAYTGTIYGLWDQRTFAAPAGTTALPDASYSYNVFNNTFATPTALLATGAWYYMSTGQVFNTASPLSKTNKWVSNQIINISAGHNGAVYCIYPYSAGSTISTVIDSNLINNYRRINSGTAGLLYGIYGFLYYHGPTATTSVNANTVTNVNCPTAGTGGFQAIYLSQQTTTGVYSAPYTMTNNVVNNNFHNGTGIFYGVFGNGYGPGSSLSNNTITNNRVGGTMYGVYSSSAGNAAANLSIANNIVANDTTNSATALMGGIYVFGGVYTLNGHKNNVSNLRRNTAPTGATDLMYGIYSSITIGGTANWFNNIVSDFRVAPAPTVPGFSRNVGAYLLGQGTNNFYHNTLRLDSAGVRPALFNGATGILYGLSTGSQANIFNNIVYVDHLSFGTASQVSAIRKAALGTANTAPPVSGSTTVANLNINNNAYYVPVDTNNFYFVEGASMASLVNGFKPFDGTTASGVASTTSNLVIDTFFNTSCGAYKRFMALGSRESATFSEKNLTSLGTTPPTFAPAGSSFAESGALPLSAPAGILSDYNAVSRATNPDMGALQFSGTANDNAGPSISFSPIANTICSNSPALSVTITDPSGVLFGATGTKPRLYFKKSSNANVLPASNTAADDGWKWVEPTNGTSPYNFSIDYSLLFSSGGAVAGDVIQYFIVAQDGSVLNNFGNSGVTFPSTFCPDSVELAAAAFPVAGFSSYTLAVQPNVIPTIANASTFCGSGTPVLSLDAALNGATFQWQVLNSSSTWVNIPGATNATYTPASAITNSTSFRAQVFCSGVPISPGSPTQTLVVNVFNPLVNTINGDTRCGPGTVNFTATPSTGDTIKWFANANGGLPLATGNAYSPSVLATSSFYAAAVSPLGAHQLNQVNDRTYFTSTSQYSQEIEIQAAGGAFLDSVQMGFNNITAGNISILVYDSSGTTLLFTGPTTSVIVPSALVTNQVIPIPATHLKSVPVGFFLPPGKYRITTPTTITASPFYNFFSGGYTFPMSTAAPNIARINVGAGFGTTGAPSASQERFFRYWLRASCVSSPRTIVTATVTPPPSVTVTRTPATGDLCIGSTFTMVASSVDTGYAYAWNPGAIPVFGTKTDTAKPVVTASTVYTCTASNSATGCGFISTVSVTTFAPPPFVGINNANPSVCVGGTATFSIVDSAAGANNPLPSGYCVPTYTSSGKTDDFINNVTLSGPSGTLISNLASGDGVLGCSAAGCDYYAYPGAFPTVYTASTIPTLLPGVTYTLTTQAGTAFGQGFRVYLDYNRDGIFQASEDLMNFASSTNLNTGTFTIPATTSQGRAMLRVQCRYASIPAQTEVCAVTSFGETEDYEIKLGYPNSPATLVTWTSNPVVTTSPVTPPSTFTVAAGPIASTTTFTATVADANGCTVALTTTVNVGPMVCAPITTSKATSCPCAPVTLTASATGGSAPYSYEWYAGTTLLGGNPTLLVSPCVTTTYSVVIKTTVAGCLDSCTQTFTQNVAPTLSLTAVNTAGGPIQICSNSTSTVSVTAGGASTYSFTPSTNVTPASGAGPFICGPISTTTYTMTGIDANSCTATTLVVVTVRKKDTIEIRATPGANICAGGTVTLSVTDTVYGADNVAIYCTPTVGAAGPCITKVQVAALNSLTPTTCTLPSYSSNAAGSLPGGAYTNLVKGTSPSITVDVPSSGYVGAWLDANRNGNFETGEFTSVVVFNPTGTVPLVIPGTAVEGLTMLRVRSSSNAISAGDTCTTNNVLDGETEDYLVRIIRLQTPIVSQVWATPFPNNPGTVLTTSTSNPMVASGLTGLSIPFLGNPVTANVFQVTATDANGCTNQTTIAVNSGALSIAAITSLGGVTSRCSGQPLQLTANPIGGGMPYTYSWSDGSGIVGTGKVLTTFPTNTTTAAIVIPYTVTVTDACTPGAVTATTINITINPRPTVQFSIGNQPLCNGLGTTNILINNSGSTSVTSFSSVTSIFPTGPFSPSAGAGPYQWPLPAGSAPPGNSTYTITGVNSSTGCTNTTALTLAFSPAFGTNPIATPANLGPCGGTLTLTTNDTSAGPTTLPCTYAAAPHSSANTPITNVLYKTINNSSALTTALPSYVYYPPTPTTTATIIAGVPTPISVAINGTGSISVWIDWDRNCLFNTNEHFQLAGISTLTTPPISTGGVTAIPITVPATALPGLTRMRIRTRTSGSANGPGDATINFGSGETEDYDITILAAPALPITTYCWSYIDSNTVLQNIGCGRPITSVPAAKAPGVTYTVTATNSVGCTTTSTVNISIGNINCLPITTWKDTVCNNQCDTLTANQSLGGSPYTYAWTGDGIVGAATTKKITVCPTYTASAGTLDSFTYTCIITDACGTTCSAVKKIYMRPIFPLSISANGADTICGSGTKTFVAVPNTYTSYAWTGSGLATTSTATVTATIGSSSNYVVTALAAGGCTSTASDSVTFSSPFTTTAFANPTTLGCSGTVTLSAIDTILGAGPQVDPNCYAATGVTSNTASDHLVNVIFPLATTPQINNPTGACTPSTPTGYCGLQAQPTPTIIVGQSYTLSMSVNNGGTEFGGFWIDWNRNCTFDASEYFNVPLTLATSWDGTALVTVPAGAVPGITRMRVRSKWAAALTATESIAAYSFGETEDYLVNVIAKVPSATFSYTWNGGSLVNAPGNPLPSGTISGTTDYVVTSTNSLGCTAVDTITINVASITCGPITTPNLTVCSGAPFVLTANPIGGGTPYTYSWSVSGNTAMSDTITVVNPGSTDLVNNYSVVITDACGASCGSSISITIRPAPTATITPTGPINVCNGATTAALTAATSSANSTVSSVNWLAPAGASVTPTTGLTTTATVPPSGLFTVVATDANSCTGASTVQINFAPVIPLAPSASPTNVGSCATTVTLSVVPSTITASYCVPTFASIDYSELFNFGLGTTLASPNNIISNATVCGSLGSGASNGLPASIASQYNNYSNLPFGPTPLAAGGKYYLTYSIDTCNFAQGINFPYYASVWVDLNRDGDFNDLGEQVHAPTTVTPGAYTQLDSFTINPLAVVTTGRTIMRVIVANNNGLPISSIAACGAYFDGETEDYSVLVGPPGLTYTWSASTGGGLVTSSGPLVTASPVGEPSYTYTVTATNSIGCTTSQTVVVTSNPFTLDSVTNKGRTVATGICLGKCDTVRIYRRGGSTPYAASFAPTTAITMINDSVYTACPTTTTTYTVTYSDACGTSDSKVFTVNVRNLPSVAFTPDSVVSCNGAANLSIPSPVAPACVSSTWSPVGPPGLLSVSINTTYTYTCTDGFGCTNTATFRAIVNYPHIIKTKAQPDTICYGATAVLSFTDTSTATGPQTDPNCYTNPGITSNTGGDQILNVTFPVGAPTLISNSTGTCTATPVTGYCGVQSTPIPVVFSATTYTISLTVNNGGTEFGGAWFDWNRNCIFDASEYVNIPLVNTGNYVGTATVTVPATAVAGITRVRVRSKYNSALTATESIAAYSFGETEDYLINIIASAPASVVSYTWQSGTDTISGTGAPAPITTDTLTTNTVYTLTVVGSGGCTYTATQLVVVGSEIVNTETVVDSPSCYGFTSGIISAAATGGTGTISTLLLSLPSNTQLPGSSPYINLPAGSYKAIYTDAKGCKDSSTVTMNQPDSLNITVGFSGATCFGSNSGTAFASVTGGSGPYSYAWTDNLGSTLLNTTSPLGDTIFNLASGTYSVYVFDAKACAANKDFIVTQPAAPLSVSLVGTDSVLCKGGSNGAIEVATTGGTPGYQYNLGSGLFVANNGLFTGLQAGNYTVVVTDTTNVCTDTVIVTVGEPTDSLKIASISFTDTNKCFGDSTCDVMATITGGTAPYTYLWSNGQTTSTATNFAAGSYTVTATDFNGCTVSSIVVVNEPTELFISSATLSHVTCNGSADGSASFTITGGTPNASMPMYNISPSPTGLAAGSYTFTISDANGCNKTTVVTITEAPVLSITTVSVQPTLCNAVCDGTAKAVVSGGTGTYAYEWKGSAGVLTGTADSISGLCAGIYTLTVNSPAGCADSLVFSIIQPSPIAITGSVVTNESCFNACDGSLTVAGSGGVGTYEYNLNGTGWVSTDTFKNLCDGSYVVTVRDANQICTTTISLTITGATSAIAVTAVVDSNAKCNGDANGAATATATGGSGTVYTYEWQDASGVVANTASANGLKAGTYTVFASDVNLCSTSTTIIITEPDSLKATIAISSPVACNGDSAIISVTATGGTLTYTGTGSYTVAASATAYTYTVTDANMCSTTATIMIMEPAALVIDSVVVAPVNCASAAGGSVMVYASGGTTAYSYTWQANSSTTDMASGYAAGTYTVQVDDANACSAVGTFTITQDQPIVIDSVSVTNVTCFGDSNGTATVFVAGIGAYTYSWQSNISTSTFAGGYKDGTYTVTVSASNGCSVDTSFTISGPSAALTATATAAMPVCAGDTVIVTVASSGGNSGMVTGVGTFTVTTNGTYSYTVTDAMGCTAETTITIMFPSAVTISNLVVTNATCFGDSAGSVAITAAGGTVAGAYNITPSTTGLAAGNYVFTVMDDNMCSVDTSIAVTEGQEIIIVVDSVVNAACGGSNGMFGISATGGSAITLMVDALMVTNPYVNSTATASIYTIVATDANSCTTSSTVQIISVSPTTLGVTANASATTVCNLTSITLWGSSSLGNTLDYTWDNGVIDSMSFPLAAGTYTYVVTGTDLVTGCAEQDTINITSTVQAALLSQASANNAQSIAGNSCDANMQTQGSTVDYTDNSCALIATVTDGTGGNALGNVQACVTVQGPVNIYNGQPYASRVFNILPQFQPTAGDSATVTLYYTHDDILDFNAYIVANSSPYPQFISNGSLSAPANGDIIANANITKFDDTLGLGSGSGFLYGVTLVYDAANMRWSTTFKIPSFSFFFLHTKTIDVPLSAELVSLQGYKQGSADVLAWTTINEKNMSHFNLLRGSTSTNMQPIANNIATKAPNGTSTKALNYQFIDSKPMVGHNYYKLEMVNKAGKVSTSDVVDIYWAVDGAQIAIYPNPADNKLNVDVNIERNTAAKIRIYDATGKLVRQVEAQLNKGLNATVIELGDMAAGMYLIKVTDGKALNYSQQFRKL
jgi:hypothetical protein